MQHTKRKPAVPETLIYGKVPPQAKELETYIIGAIMLDKNAFDTVIEILKPESFYVDAHQKIFAAMVSLAAKQQPIDMHTVVEELKRLETLDLVGGVFYIMQLTNGVVKTVNVDAYARIVAEKATLRNLIAIGSEMIAEAYEDSADAFDLLDKTDGAISGMISGNMKKPFVAIGDAIVQAILRIEQLRQNDSHITGTPSGFAEIDRITHGWQDTDLIILAARPSVGKTAFALNLARNASKHYLANSGKSIGFFSLEMSTGQLTNRMLSAETGIWLDKISNGQLEEYEMKTLYKQGEVFGKRKIFVDDQSSMNIFELRAKARRLKAKHNVGLIIIDYLQLMSGIDGTKNTNREQEISKISRELKGLAKELKVPIIALSQLSREVEKRSDKQPQLSDLRESGAIEQDADMVMFMYRPEYYNITADDMGETTKGETHIKIAKHRNGTLETVKLQAQLHIQKFVDYDHAADLSTGFKPAGANWKPVAMQQDDF